MSSDSSKYEYQDELEPFNPIQRTRVFDPADVTQRSEDEIRARLEELIAKRKSFDPKIHFTGLRRLGSTYTVAEPLAFFDGPTPDQQKFTYTMIGGIGGLVTVFAFMASYKLKRAAYLTGAVRGLIAAPIFGWASCKFYDWILRDGQRKNNILLHYALLHEDEFPVIERKKFGEVIQNWTPHRSLHNLGEGNFSFKI